jgi:hypothetical protein
VGQKITKHGGVGKVGPIVAQAVGVTATLRSIYGDTLAQHVTQLSGDDGLDMGTVEVVLRSSVF